jgi:hypothetical protein
MSEPKLTDPALTLEEFQAMTLTAAVEAAMLWLRQVPGGPDHVAAGAGLVLEVTLQPDPALQLLLIDSDGTRYPVAERQLRSAIRSDSVIKRKPH